MVSSGSGSGSSGTSSGVTTIRYAPYVESHHQGFLSRSSSETSIAIGNNPYDDFENVPVDVGFFGSGYSLANFPSLYDMYGKFIAGLNIEAIWTELFNDTVNSSEAADLVRAENNLLTDELDTIAMPRFQAGMRDLNAVNSSTFIVGRALLEDGKQKMVSKFSADLKYRLISVTLERYKTHLGWNSSVISTYLDVMKYYFSIKQAYTEMEYGMLDRYGRWPLEMLDYQRAGLGALQGATKTQTSGTADAGGGASTGSKVLGGALSGAAAGAFMGGGPIGAVAGGILGGLAGLL